MRFAAHHTEPGGCASNSGGDKAHGRQPIHGCGSPVLTGNSPEGPGGFRLPHRIGRGACGAQGAISRSHRPDNARSTDRLATRIRDAHDQQIRGGTAGDGLLMVTAGLGEIGRWADLRPGAVRAADCECQNEEGNERDVDSHGSLLGKRTVVEARVMNQDIRDAAKRHTLASRGPRRAIPRRTHCAYRTRRTASISRTLPTGLELRRVEPGHLDRMGAAPVLNRAAYVVGAPRQGRRPDPRLRATD